MSELEALLLRAKQGDRAASERLITENSGLVWSVARRYFGRGVDADDLFQLGCLGFLKAVEGYDPAFGTQFSTYAVPKISGEIRRFLRDDGTVKVSRGLKERALAIRAAQQKFLAERGREPTVGELSNLLGLTPEEIAAAEGATGSAESIHRKLTQDGFSLEDVLTDGDMEEDILERLSLREAIASLPERERAVIFLRFFHGLTQDKAAKLLGVSQVQVSRIEKKALEGLRRRICETNPQKSS